MIGVGTTSPVPAAASPVNAETLSGVRAIAASASTVGHWKTSRSVSSISRRRARVTRRIVRMLSPPSAKKVVVNPHPFQRQDFREQFAQCFFLRRPRGAVRRSLTVGCRKRLAVQLAVGGQG